MKNLLVIGHPLEFCLVTPVLNGAFEATGFAGHFETRDIEPEAREDVIAELRAGDLYGLVLTRPYKTPSLESVEEVTEDVRWIGAVNLLKMEGEKMMGYNTDWLGARDALLEKIPSLKDKHVLVLGLGGAARAAAYAAHTQGAKVSIWNRTGLKAKDFAAARDLEWVEDMRNWDGRPDVIVNATSASDQPRQSTLVPMPVWQNVQVAMDAVYGKTSLFLEEALAMNVPSVLSGDVWFLKQASRMFEIFAQAEAPKAIMQELTANAKEIIRTNSML